MLEIYAVPFIYIYLHYILSFNAFRLVVPNFFPEFFMRVGFWLSTLKYFLWYFNTKKCGYMRFAAEDRSRILPWAYVKKSQLSICILTVLKGRTNIVSHSESVKIIIHTFY